MEALRTESLALGGIARYMQSDTAAGTNERASGASLRTMFEDCSQKQVIMFSETGTDETHLRKVSRVMLRPRLVRARLGFNCEDHDCMTASCRHIKSL